MRTNYVLIDYENVQPEAMAALNQEHIRVIVFVGASQAKVSYEIAFSLQRMGDRAEYVKISGNGPNALDFHIAYYIGDIASRDPNSYFHIISADAGFDPLIQHLRSKKILCRRSGRVADIPFLKGDSPTLPDDRLSAVVADLQRRGQTRPKSEKTLAGTIHALFRKELSDSEVAGLIAELQRQRLVIIQNDKVSYALPVGDDPTPPPVAGSDPSSPDGKVS